MKGLDGARGKQQFIKKKGALKKLCKGSLSCWGYFGLPFLTSPQTLGTCVKSIGHLKAETVVYVFRQVLGLNKRKSSQELFHSIGKDLKIIIVLNRIICHFMKWIYT